MSKTIFYVGGLNNNGDSLIARYQVGGGHFLVPAGQPIEIEGENSILVTTAANTKYFFYVSWIPAWTGQFSCTLTACVIGKDGSLMPCATMDLTDKVGESQVMENPPVLLCNSLFRHMVYVRFANGDLQTCKIDGARIIPIGNPLKVTGCVAFDDSGEYLYTVDLDQTTLNAACWKLRAESKDGMGGSLEKLVDSKRMDIASTYPDMDKKEDLYCSVAATSDPDGKSLLYVVTVMPNGLSLNIFISLFEIEDGKFVNAGVSGSRVPTDCRVTYYPVVAHGRYVYAYAFGTMHGWKVEVVRTLHGWEVDKLRATPVARATYVDGLFEFDHQRKHLCAFDELTASVLEVDDKGGLALVPYKTVIALVLEESVLSVTPVVMHSS